MRIHLPSIIVGLVLGYYISRNEIVKNLDKNKKTETTN